MEHEHVVYYVQTIIPFYIRQLDTEKQYIVSDRVNNYINLKFPEADFDEKHELIVYWFSAIARLPKKL